MQRLFCVTGRISLEISNSWAAIAAREFYDGDLQFETEGVADFSFDKALCYPMSLTMLSSDCGISYRRNWQHIRLNQVGLQVILFVRRGSLRIARSQGMCEVKEGFAAIINSDVPFHMKIIPDSLGRCESYQLTVPAHMFLTHLQEADQLAAPFSLNSPEGQVVMRLLEFLVRDGETLSKRTAQPLGESLLEAIADCIGYRNAELPRRQRLVDKRLTDIENYILMNLADPDLCCDRVAASCGISPRYLCYILKANNTSFSDLLWKNRLPKARDFLIAPAAQDYPIHKIAFMSGFKSAAHFSRMFKAAYGCPPREFRAAGRHPAERNMPLQIVDLGELERDAA